MALARALDVFWKEGFAATSLDDLSAATGMNRPSLYGAFGDKRELYIKSYERYRDARASRDGRNVSRTTCRCGRCCSASMRIALDMYLSGEDGPRGCFTVMTATSEAVFDPEIRAMVLSRSCRDSTASSPACFRLAQGARRIAGVRRSRGAGATRVGDHPHHRHPRPRAGAARELEAIVNGAIDVMLR